MADLTRRTLLAAAAPLAAAPAVTAAPAHAWETKAPAAICRVSDPPLRSASILRLNIVSALIRMAASCKTRAPSAVSKTPCGPRSNKMIPRSCSSDLMMRVRCGWLIFRRWAALWKFRVAAKACAAFKRSSILTF